MAPTTTSGGFFYPIIQLFLAIPWWVWELGVIWCFTLAIGIAIGYKLAKKEVLILDGS